MIVGAAEERAQVQIMKSTAIKMHRETVKSTENYCPPHLILYRGRSRTYISMMISLQLGFLKLLMSLAVETELLIFHRQGFLKCACSEQPSSKKYKEAFMKQRAEYETPREEII